MKWNLARNGLDRTALTRAAILVIALALLAILLYRQVDRWRGAPVDLWVAGADLAPGAVVRGDQLVKKTVREPNLPANVVLDRGIIEGRQLARAKSAGSPFFRNDFAAPDRGPGLAGILPEGRVLVLLRLRGVPVDDLAEQLRFGDRLDIIAAAGGAWTAAVAHDAFFLGWISQRQPAAESAGGGGLIGNLTAAVAESQPSPQGASPVLLGVHPQDAVPLAEAEAAGLGLSLVLHGKSEVDKGELLILPRPRLNEVEFIAGARRERIPLTRLQLQ